MDELFFISHTTQTSNCGHLHRRTFQTNQRHIWKMGSSSHNFQSFSTSVLQALSYPHSSWKRWRRTPKVRIARMVQIRTAALQRVSHALLSAREINVHGWIQSRSQNSISSVVQYFPPRLLTSSLILGPSSLLAGVWCRRKRAAVVMTVLFSPRRQYCFIPSLRISGTGRRIWQW